jgi:hypothetical protein
MSAPPPEQRHYRALYVLTAILLGVPLAAVIAWFAMAFTAKLFDIQGWPIFHTWGMMHGGVCIFFPVYFAVAFALIAWALARLFLRGRRGPPS